MVAAALLIALTVGLMWQRWQLGDAYTFMKMQWGEWPHGAGLFAVGVWAGEAGSLDDLAAWARRLGWTALTAATLWAALAVYVKTTGHCSSGSRARRADVVIPLGPAWKRLSSLATIGRGP